MTSRPEIMAPAGSFEALQAAIKAGADSIYFGVGALNMRSRAANFGYDDLPEVARICRRAGVKAYLTLNTIIHDGELELVRDICRQASAGGVSAVIAMDIAAIRAARACGLPVHLSTQVNVTNIEAVRFYAAHADVVVLARELTLGQITAICGRIREEEIRGPSGELVGIEIFVHGALCIAISGKCNMSLSTYGHSANRGDCLQNCRRGYRVIDDQTGAELSLENEYVMSPGDLCTLPFLDEIIGSGVSVLKIEGRGRGADYVHAVTKAYAAAARAVADGSFDQERVGEWMKEVSSVYNRGFWEGGYYLGRKISEWSAAGGSKATLRREMVGVVRNYYKQAGIAEVHARDNGFEAGTPMIITGPTTGLVELLPENLRADDVEAVRAPKGSIVTFACPERVRANDKVFVLLQRK